MSPDPVYLTSDCGVDQLLHVILAEVTDCCQLGQETLLLALHTGVIQYISVIVVARAVVVVYVVPAIVAVVVVAVVLAVVVAASLSFHHYFITVGQCTIAVP